MRSRWRQRSGSRRWSSLIQVRDEGTGTQSGDQPNGGSTIPTVEPAPALSATGDVDPGRHVFSSSDPAFDASHRITIDVVDGYGAYGGAAVLTDGGSVSTLAVSAVWADPCQWQGSVLDRLRVRFPRDQIRRIGRGPFSGSDFGLTVRGGRRSSPPR